MWQKKLTKIGQTWSWQLLKENTATIGGHQPVPSLSSLQQRDGYSNVLDLPPSPSVLKDPKYARSNRVLTFFFQNRSQSFYCSSNAPALYISFLGEAIVESLNWDFGEIAEAISFQEMQPLINFTFPVFIAIYLSLVISYWNSWILINSAIPVVSVDQLIISTCLCVSGNGQGRKLGRPQHCSDFLSKNIYIL